MREATNETSSHSLSAHHPSSHHSNSHHSNSHLSNHASATNELSLSSRLNERCSDTSLSTGAHSGARPPAGLPQDGPAAGLSRGGNSSASSQGGDASRSGLSAPGSGGEVSYGRGTPSGGGGRMRSLLEEGEVAAESLMGILDEAERMQDEGGGGGGGGASELSVLASEGLRDRQAGGGGGAARGKGLHPPQADNAGFPNVSLIEQDSSFGGYTLDPKP